MNLQAKAYSAFLHIALVALGGLVFVLAKENQELKNLSSSEAEATLELGQAIEPVRIQSLEGEENTLDFESGTKDRLMLVFTTTCPACEVNQSAWRKLHEQVGDAAEIVGVSLSEVEATRAYSTRHDLLFPVTVPADRDRFSEVFNISAVPFTVRIGADGRVRGSWLGTLSEAQLAEVFPLDRG